MKVPMFCKLASKIWAVRRKLEFISGKWKFVNYTAPEVEQEDPQSAYKNTVYELIKNTFSLAFGEDGELRINVDNVYPMLKTIGLNPRSESIMDLVRDASMESIGDIDPGDFERVIMSMVKAIDDELWTKRLEEKEHDRIQKESERAKAEAEKLRIAQEREKVGFEQEEDEKDEWEEYEKQKEEEEKQKKKEEEKDELYDNLKMAFRFIDSDGDGVISTQDIYNLMMGLGEMLTDDELFGMVNMADLDCDGKVTFDDFRQFLSTAEELEIAEAKQAGEEKQQETQPDEKSEERNTEEEEVPKSDGTENKEITIDSSNEKQEDSSENIDTGKDKSNDNTVTPAPSGASDPDAEERLRRKRSMLWGYMKSASNLMTAMQKPTEQGTPEPKDSTQDITKAKEPEPTSRTDNDQVDTPDGPDASGQLDAIREEDEHSNYDLEESDRVESKMDNKITSVAEHKRKIFSRQSSAASLKAQGLAGCESIGDSGIDTINGSEIREQPDVFDISDDEEGTLSDSRHVTSPTKRKNSLSTCDIYTTDNEDDEDMVDAHHVHESLSRVSSMESLDDLKDQLPKDDDNKEDRIRSFVNQSMYIDIRQVSEDSETIQEKIVEQEEPMKHVIDEHKMARAQILQKAILKRSATAPALTVTTGRIEKPVTPKPSVNGLVCSHIDIDLTCESPPKADIKSTVMFNERVKSARMNRPRPESARSTKTITVVDISETVGKDKPLSQAAEKSRWPMRPLTRPRSPRFRRVQSATSRKSSSDSSDACELSIDVISERTPRGRPNTPFCRTRSSVFSSSDVPKHNSPSRPQTARSYSTSRTIDVPVMKYEKKDNISLVVTEPFKNAEELYPRKELLTTYHHGFKSIWPIGRKANLIRHKRPFSAFEMNSYSRSIERSEFPLHIEENVSKLNPDSTRTVPSLSGTGLVQDSKVIKLELEGASMCRPVSRNSSPIASVRQTRTTTPRVLCRFR